MLPLLRLFSWMRVPRKILLLRPCANIHAHNIAHGPQHHPHRRHRHHRQVRLWEDGWKDRYYSDKCKLDDIEGGGGRERLFQTYVEGLCWVMLYYYQGCPSWTWYFPFHYAPFASDLINCDR